MTTTFLKRQKEMKRLEKARSKAERRAQKKFDKSVRGQALAESSLVESATPPTPPEPQN